MIDINNVDVKFIVDSSTQRKRNFFGQTVKETIHAVKKVSLKISKGELVVLMGLSGFGQNIFVAYYQWA